MENLDQIIKVSVEVAEAEANLDNIKKKAEEAAESVEDIGKAAKGSDSQVGGLDKAFESVFNTISKEGGKGGVALKKVFDSVKNAIPVVKNINNTAITGLKGIKAGIASTGIGLLAIALGEILAHWQDIAKWIGIGTKEQEAYTKAVKDSEAQMEKLNWQHERQTRLLKAAGASSVELAELAVKQAEETRKQVIVQYEYNQALVLGKKQRKELREEAEKDLEAANKRVQEAKRELELVKEEEKVREEARKKSEKSTKTTAKAVKETEDPAKKLREELEKIKKDTKDVMETMSKIAQNVGGEWPKESVDYFKNLLNPESVRADSEEVIKELKKAGVEINEAIINQLLVGDAQKYNNELSTLVSERGVIFATGRRSLAEDLTAELEIQKTAFGQEEHLLLKRMRYIKKYAQEESADYLDLNSQLEVLSDKRETFIREQSRKIADAILDERLGVIDAALDSLLDVGDRWAGLNGGLWGKGMADLYKAQQQAQADYFAQMRDTYDVGTQEYEAYAAKYEEITERLNGFDGKRTQFVFQQIDQQYEYWNKLVSSIGSLFGTLADIYEEDIKAKQERGEISEDEAKDEFERVKKLQLAEVWMNTIAGSIGAFLQASAAYPAPWGQILGAATAATVLASGIAQHKKIQNTQYGDTGGSSGGGGVPRVGVTPIEVTDDIQASPTTLADSQTAKDLRVYILEGDIQESNKKVEVREANSTF